jgi:putative hemolysin
MRRTLFAVVVLALALCGACGDDDGSDETELPNPASAYCVEQGGTVELVDEAGGTVGYCNLPDGTRVEEWEYYRGQQQSTGIANPAAVFCEDSGGTYGLDDGTCTLPDGQVVDGWEWFRSQSTTTTG